MMVHVYTIPALIPSIINCSDSHCAATKLEDVDPSSLSTPFQSQRCLETPCSADVCSSLSVSVASPFLNMHDDAIKVLSLSHNQTSSTLDNWHPMYCAAEFTLYHKLKCDLMPWFSSSRGSAFHFDSIARKMIHSADHLDTMAVKSPHIEMFSFFVVVPRHLSMPISPAFDFQPSARCDEFSLVLVVL